MKILITGGSGFIGTNLVEYYLEQGDEILNIDFKIPKIKSHELFWENIDIRDYQTFKKAVDNFAPQYIIHLAARANLSGKTLDDYSSNITGVENLIRIANETESVEKVLFTSTMLVCKAGYHPENDNDYCPTTIYGQSKMIGEKKVKSAKVNFKWVILRPTSIWGPWFGKTYAGFFEMIMNRKYFNFSGPMCSKTYGYIGNVVYEYDMILKSSEGDFQTLYIGDYEPTNIKEWAVEIADGFNYKLMTIPRIIVRIAAIVGDILNKLKIYFPITSFRLSNMTTDNIVDLKKTQLIAPEIKYTRKEGNRITIDWMKKALK